MRWLFFRPSSLSSNPGAIQHSRADVAYELAPTAIKRGGELFRESREVVRYNEQTELRHRMVEPYLS